MPLREGNALSEHWQSVLEASASRPDHAGYAGNLSPAEAWAILQQHTDAQLVDVRTEVEWRSVGLPQLDALGKEPLLLSWLTGPDFAPNPHFTPELTAKLPDREAPVLMLCRSGGRSRAAAMAATQAGYRHAYNITDGFEGPHTQGSPEASGWKADGLPWRQTP